MSNELLDRSQDTLFYAAQMHLFDALGETNLDRLAAHLNVSKQSARRTLAVLEGEGLLTKVSFRPVVCKLSNQGLHALGLV